MVARSRSGTRPDALGRGCGRLHDAPKPILGRPGRAEGGQEPSKSVPKPFWRRSKTLSVSGPSACGASSAVERAFESMSRRFYFAARKLRCASRTSFYSVLLPSQEIRTERARAATNLKNRSVSPPKSSRRAAERPKIGAGRAKLSENVRSKCLRGLQKFISERERGNFKREGVTAGGQDACVPRVLPKDFR